MTLIAVLAVMNGFQLSSIEPILEVISYHIQLRYGHNETLPLDLLEEFKSINQLNSIVPYADVQALIDMKTACIIRGIPVDAMERDRGFAGIFVMDAFYSPPDKEHLEGQNSILLGNILAQNCSGFIDNTISVTIVAGDNFQKLTPRSFELKITGEFKTWFYNLDSNWALVSLSTLQELLELESLPVTYGIKVENKEDVTSVLNQIEGILLRNNIEDYSIKTWKDYDPAFFNALKTEKLSMMILIGLIFIVVGFNIYYSLRRSVYEKLEEIGILKAIGVTSLNVQYVFMTEGFIIGLLGAVIGLILGFLISNNINLIFRFTETIINEYLFRLIEYVLSQFVKITLPSIDIFSPRVFYIDEVPTRVFLSESFLIAFFAIFSSIIAAYFSSKKISKTEPVLLLRWE